MAKKVCKWKDFIQRCSQWYCSHGPDTTYAITRGVTSGEPTGRSNAALVFSAHTTNVRDGSGAARSTCPRLLSSPHQHWQTRGSLSHCSNFHHECYERYEWMVWEPMEELPTLQQQPRNRPFGRVTCSQVTCWRNLLKGVWFCLNWALTQFLKKKGDQFCILKLFLTLIG